MPTKHAATKTAIDNEMVRLAGVRAAEYVQRNAERFLAAGKPTRAKPPADGWYVGPGKPDPSQ